MSSTRHKKALRRISWPYSGCRISQRVIPMRQSAVKATTTNFPTTGYDGFVDALCSRLVSWHKGLKELLIIEKDMQCQNWYILFLEVQKQGQDFPWGKNAISGHSYCEETDSLLLPICYSVSVWCMYVQTEVCDSIQEPCKNIEDQDKLERYRKQP